MAVFVTREAYFSMLLKVMGKHGRYDSNILAKLDGICAVNCLLYQWACRWADWKRSVEEALQKGRNCIMAWELLSASKKSKGVALDPRTKLIVLITICFLFSAVRVAALH